MYLHTAESGMTNMDFIAKGRTPHSLPSAKLVHIEVNVAYFV